MRASGASELRKFWYYYILKLLFLSFILLVHQILCRYKWHACRLTCTDKFPNVPTNFQIYQQNSEKALLGWQLPLPPLPPPPPPPPSGYANALLVSVMSQQYNCLWNCTQILMKMYLPSTFILRYMLELRWMCMHLWMNWIKKTIDVQ